MSAKHRAVQASKRLRGAHTRLDDNLSPQQMQQRRGLFSDFLFLKIKGFKPFFRAPPSSTEVVLCRAHVPEGRPMASGHQLPLSFSLARLTSLLMLWPWILLRYCGRLVFQSARHPTRLWCLNLGHSLWRPLWEVLPHIWTLTMLAASFRIAPLIQGMRAVSFPR